MPAKKTAAAAVASALAAWTAAPLSCVVVKEGHEREGEAGVVERLAKDAAGAVVGVVVDMDVDHERVEFKPGQLQVIAAH